MQEAAEILALGVVPDAEFPAARQVLAPLVLEGVVDAGGMGSDGLEAITGDIST